MEEGQQEGQSEIPEGQPVISSVSPESETIDHELEEILKKQAAKIRVIGIGGGGNNPYEHPHTTYS